MSALCSWCDYESICPARKHFVILEKLDAAALSEILRGLDDAKGEAADVADFGPGEAGDDGSHREATQKKFLKRWILIFVGVSSLLTLLAFAWSLKDVGSESRRQVIEGTVLAVLVIGGVAWLLRVVVRFFEEQSRFEEEVRRENQPHPDEDNENR